MSGLVLVPVQDLMLICTAAHIIASLTSLSFV